MPPKKRARLTPSNATTPLASSPQPSDLPDAAVDESAEEGDGKPDPWSTAQQTALFKALIRYKPTGPHKHFHMLSVQNHMRSHGYSTSSTHTRIPGIWEKLGELYDLEALDEREQNYGLDQMRTELEDEGLLIEGSASREKDSPSLDWYKEFTVLPGKEFDLQRDDKIEELAWKRRFPKQGAEDENDFDPQLPWKRGPDGFVELTELGKKKGGPRKDSTDIKTQVTSGRRSLGRNSVRASTEGTEDAEEVGDNEQSAEGRRSTRRRVK